MKHAAVIIATIVCLTMLGCNTERKNNVEGTWRLIAGTSKTADSTYDYSMMDYDGMKMISNGHFMFVGRYLQNGDTAYNYGGGTYTLEGNHYTEILKYFPVKSMLGDTLSYEVQVRNDSLIQKGPRKIGKYKNVEWELYEVYRRAE